MIGTAVLLTTPVALAAAGRVSADGNGTGVDISAYEGKGSVLVSVHFVSGTSTYDGKLQECATSGGTYTDVTGGAITQVGTTDPGLIKIDVDINALQAFVRWVDDVGGAGSPVYDRCVLLVATKKQG